MSTLNQLGLGASLAMLLYLIGSVTIRLNEAIGRWWDIRHPDPNTAPKYLGRMLVNTKMYGVITDDQTPRPAR